MQYKFYFFGGNATIKAISLEEAQEKFGTSGKAGAPHELDDIQQLFPHLFGMLIIRNMDTGEICRVEYD